ncbi:uncharacterized protein LOC128953531 [Oppia nitens]|uniref:uncharacterized protein LOC128953531 n=1 Tax=Oppia nitens TaxID=1686743 RepID=UPI0023DBC387|nr:uncharacterized protein LOC128953531 [Oppia nitens]
MYIYVVTLQPFNGVVHTRGHRKHPCLVQGSGGFNTTIKVSLLANEGDELYCGYNKFNGDRSVSVAVRPHKSLELSDDKYYFMTCQQLGYKSVRGGTYSVTLRVTDLSGQRVTRAVHGSPYILRAQLHPFDIITTLRVKNCFSFSTDRDHVQLLDESGCPTKTQLMSQFLYNSSHSAEAIVYEMFKFSDTNKIFIQCDAILCRGGCQEPVCDSATAGDGTGAVDTKPRELAIDSYSQISASTSLYVFEPSEESLLAANLTECNEWRFPWLIVLCIVLTVLLVLMLLVNLFMCSSLSCRCVKTEVIEREPSEVDDYDPYHINWITPNTGYTSGGGGGGGGGGSRMSLNRSAFNNNSFTSNKSLAATAATNRSHHLVYYRDHFVPKHYSTLQSSSAGGHTTTTNGTNRPLSRYSTHSTKSQTSQKSRKSQKSQKLPKIVEIDYSNDFKPFTYSLR